MSYMEPQYVSNILDAIIALFKAGEHEKAKELMDKLKKQLKDVNMVGGR